MEYAQILLTEEQRRELTELSPHISEWEISKHYTLSEFDIELINQHRKDYNRVGFALQLCYLRYPGWTLTSLQSIPLIVKSYIAMQLNADISALDFYGTRENTRLKHLQEIRKVYDYRFFMDSDVQVLEEYLISYALENDNSIGLIKLAINQLRSLKIILPGITTIERIVSKVIFNAEEQIYATINKNLSQSQKDKLDNLLESSSELFITTLAHLKEEPGQSSPSSFLEIIKRLKIIRNLALDIDLRTIHPNRIKQLSRLGARYEPHSFRRFEENKRYALLVVFLKDLSERLVDFAVEIHDKQINTLLSKGRKQQDEIQKRNGKALNENVIQYINVVSVIVQSRNIGTDPYQAIESIMSWEQLTQSIEEAKKLTRPKNYDYVDLLYDKFNYLRRYTPDFLEHINFYSVSSSMNSLIRAIDIIKELNENKKRKVPEYAPIDFIPNRWSKFLYNTDGTIDRRYYEMATLTELKNRIRAGDISVEGSKNYKNFDEYIISKEEWQNIKQEIDFSFTDYINERKATLNDRFNWLVQDIDSLEDVSITNNKIHISRLEKDTPFEADGLSDKLYSMLPHIKLPELLLEVANWTQFEHHFTHASSNHSVKGKEKNIVMATLMAMGTNIGLAKMAEATPEISYHQMANVAQWRMYDDAMKRAQACLVNYQRNQDLSLLWGDGSTSSSDGMRVQIGVSALNSEHNPHYGSKKGATMYRFTSDQFSSFSVNIINTNARDAVHVIDGINNHETELCISEHYTDTAGYTDQVFGLCQLLGYKFAPRIRDISDLLLYSISHLDKVKYKKIQGVIQGKVNSKIIEDNFYDVLRLAYSIKKGLVSGSLIMSKLGSYARQNSLATALREMGRIEKTIFILEYIMDKSLRRRIQRGLNKGEAMDALARAIFFGKRGEMRERELQDQLQRASALNILINAICVWNTKYLQKAVEELRKQGDLDENLLKHISPLRWQHINFLGEYSFDNVKNMPKSNEMRELNNRIS